MIERTAESRALPSKEGGDTIEACLKGDEREVGRCEAFLHHDSEFQETSV